ncbi:MAG: hypothetical protein J0H78_16290 [Rhizobiales bacterium]|nr:hypothetical protein [Hyphomicrobiales bacterium]OJY45819.1 MAG: hypothetical protein BGP08_06335 [Rhizobiales bacterium 64-17]
MVSSVFANLRKVVVALCIAAVASFCVQTVDVIVDSVEHSLGIDHAANAAAGSVIACETSINNNCAPGETHPISHAHLGDTATPFVVVAAVSVNFIRAETESVPLSNAAAIASLSSCAPERPPKA